MTLFDEIEEWRGRKNKYNTTTINSVPFAWDESSMAGWVRDWRTHSPLNHFDIMNVPHYRLLNPSTFKNVFLLPFTPLYEGSRNRLAIDFAKLRSIAVVPSTPSCPFLKLIKNQILSVSDRRAEWGWYTCTEFLASTKP
jgi:hypothetical protein